MADLRKAGRHGKLPKRNDYRTLRFSHYLTSPLPAPAPAVDNLSRALTTLKLMPADVPRLFPMDFNDSLGCCVMAGAAHIQTLWNAFIGKSVVAGANTVRADYFHLTGGQDSGLDMLSTCNWWRKNPFNGEKILAFVAVDPKNVEHVKLAIEMFGALYTGIQCTALIDQQFDAHQPWTPGRLTNDGHAIVIPTYDADTLTCLTWGSTQAMTWPFFAECVDELYALLPPEALKEGFSATWDYAQLNADLRLL